MDVEFQIRLTIPTHDEDLITKGLLEERLKFALIGMVPQSYRPVLIRTDKNYVPNNPQEHINSGHRFHPESEPCPANCPKFTRVYAHHAFDSGYTGMSVLCNYLVLDETGSATTCNLPRESHLVKE